MKKNQIVKLLLVLFAINPYFQIQLNAENLMDQFDSQENATWDKAKYEKITKNDKGVITIYRYFIDKNSNIYRFYKVGNKNIIGPDKIGNLKKSEISTGNTCVFGTNVQCLTNITKTTTQFAAIFIFLYSFYSQNALAEFVAYFVLLLSLILSIQSGLNYTINSLKK